MVRLLLAKVLRSWLPDDGFNPTMVRLLLASLQEIPETQKVSFNPTMVRLLPTHVAGGSDELTFQSHNGAIAAECV